MAYRTPRELADRMAERPPSAKADDGYVRETFSQPREQARQTARAFLDRWPAAAYMSHVETWRELPDNRIEFTMKRLKSADLCTAAGFGKRSHDESCATGTGCRKFQSMDKFFRSVVS